MRQTLSSSLIEEFRTLLDGSGVLTGDDARNMAQGAWSDLGHPEVVLRPKNTQEVSAILKLANEAGAPVTAWGGKSGLVEGGVLDGGIALSLERMNAIEEVDRVNGTATVQAGAILQAVCETVEEKDLFFPLDLGARGSATIGGNISTNAGGNRVIRYGMMRDMVLGLEAVLADGTVVSSMNRMIKNNAGYDLKQLFIGTEGTLGIVTRAVLRVRPKPISQDTAFVALNDFQSMTSFLRHMERGLGGTLSAFEAMWASFYELVTSPPAEGRPPIPHGYPYYVLVEAMGGDQESDSARFEATLTEAIESGEVADAVIAKSQGERDRMWALRDDVAQTFHHYPIFTFDVSLRLSEMEAYIGTVKQRLIDQWPDHKAFIFGHLGDGNLHVIVSVGDGSAEAREAVEKTVYEPLAAIGGSVSAEHGIGLEKRAYLGLSRSEPELALMHLLKRTLDPKGILNPGKVLREESIPRAAE